MPPPLPRGGFGIPWGLSSSPEAPLQGELAAKQTERLYEVRPDLLRQRRGKFFRLSGFFANKNRAAGNVRTCGAVYRLEEIVLVENGFLNPVGTIKIVYFIWRKKSTRVVKSGEPALLHKTTHPEVFGLQGVSDWSCYPDSNWRPHPYQGCALPTEL